MRHLAASSIDSVRCKEHLPSEIHDIVDNLQSEINPYPVPCAKSSLRQIGQHCGC